MVGRGGGGWGVSVSRNIQETTSHDLTESSPSRQGNKKIKQTNVNFLPGPEVPGTRVPSTRSLQYTLIPVCEPKSEVRPSSNVAPSIVEEGGAIHPRAPESLGTPHQFDLKIAYLTLRIDPPTPLQQAARSERQRFQRLLVDAKDARNGFKHVVSLDEATERDAPACAENKGGGRRESRVCVLCECKGWLLLC